MKVRISHSIELEEVPEKAAELLMPAEDKLTDAVRWLDHLCRDLSRKNISAEMAAMSLDRIRRTMGECDNALAEVEGIMQGVAEHEKQQELPLPSYPPPQSDGFNEMIDEIAEDKEQLAKDMLRGLRERTE